MEPLQENLAENNVPELDLDLPSLRARTALEEVEYWKVECQKARRATEEARREGDSFLKSFSEMEEQYLALEKENKGFLKKIYSLEYQVEASQREVDKLNSDWIF